MLVICYTNKMLLGGLGDRIVGLIAVKLISKIVKQKFSILWNKENIKQYFTYNDFETLDINTDNQDEIILIDNQMGLKKYLMFGNNLFPKDVTKIYLNQEISQYLYKNDNYKTGDFLNDILNEYKQLYVETLKPTPFITNKINTYIKNKNNIIGIQFRCGDLGMITNKGERACYNNHFPNTINNIQNYLTKIKNICDKEYTDYNVFITSDNNLVYDNAIKIWNINRLIYNDDLIQHIDRKPVNCDISKVFIDNIILSQHTVKLYISEYSNFGRIAAFF